MGSFSKETVSQALRAFVNVDKSFYPEDWENAVSVLSEIICDNASSGEGYSYLANVSQTGTAAPFVVTQITNTFPTTPTFTYKSVGNYRITFSNNCWLNNYGYFNSGVCVSAGSSAIIGSFAMAAESASSVLLFTYNNSSVSANNVLNNTQIKISQTRISDINNTVVISDIHGNTKTLEFGRALYASDGLDGNLGENELPPYPPSGAFDARFLAASGYLHNGSWRDYRNIQSPNPTSEYRIRYQPGSSDPGTTKYFPTPSSGNVNINLTLNPLVQSIRIQDIITGTIFDRTIVSSGTATLSGNLDTYKFTVTYF